jgi:carbonic anhydrase
MPQAMTNKNEIELGRKASFLERFRIDLGVRQLLPEWRRLFAWQHLRSDLVAGLTVACAAVPLSLAIALASGVPPAVGLLTAIVGGIACALFGGTPLAVSGPAAAMAVLVASIVERHGLPGLLIAGLGCGLLQLVAGVTGLGKLARFVPVPVIVGFTTGIGAIILIGQLPRALGLPPPDQSHVFDVLAHIGDEMHQARPYAVALSVSAALICLLLPKVLRRVPAPLVAVVLPTLAVVLLGLPVPVIGDIPRSLPPPSLPGLPPLASLGALLGSTLAVFALASLETLLSSTSIDKLAGGPRHDPDQEMIGQGLGNLASALFGGLPVTGVIVRSALNVQAGGRTRRAALVHALLLMAMVLFLAPLIGRIPLAALAGILLVVALRMLNVAEFLHLWRTSRAEGLVCLATFAVIVLFDLIAGVQVGLAAAFLIAAVRLGQTHVRLERRGYRHARLSLGGPLTFLSTRSLDPLRQSLAEGTPHQELVIDLSDVTALDVSGAEMFSALVEQLEGRGTRLALVGLRSSLLPILRGCDPSGHLVSLLARSESEVTQLLGVEPPAGRPIERLVQGVERFQHDVSERHQQLFASLADRQAPHTLFITCSDSRIVPALITSMDPGELFIVRNVGNIIPRCADAGASAEAAAVDFAVGVLGVKEIVVCGHSGCGAMKALLQTAKPELPSLERWLDNAREAGQLDGDPTPERAAQANALLQLEHLRTYPVVQKRLAAGTLHLHAWFYDIRSNQIHAWVDTEGVFVPLTSSP